MPLTGMLTQFHTITRLNTLLIINNYRLVYRIVTRNTVHIANVNFVHFIYFKSGSYGNITYPQYPVLQTLVFSTLFYILTCVFLETFDNFNAYFFFDKFLASFSMRLCQLRSLLAPTTRVQSMSTGFCVK